MSSEALLTRSQGLPASQLTYGMTLALIAALQFGPAIGLAGYLASGATEWALIGVSRDILVLGLLLQLGIRQLGQAHPNHLLPSCRWALAMIIVFAVLSLASSSSLTIMALDQRRLVWGPAQFAIGWRGLMTLALYPHPMWDGWAR